MPRDAFRFEDTNRTMSPEIRPKSFGTFEKRAPGYIYDHVTKEKSLNKQPKNMNRVKCLLKTIFNQDFHEECYLSGFQLARFSVNVKTFNVLF